MEDYREININDWHAIGEGANSITYVSDDGNTLLNLCRSNYTIISQTYNKEILYE